MNEIVAALFVWTVNNSGYAAPPDPPVIEYRDQAFFDERACPPASVHCSARGFYEDGSNIIVLHESYRALDGVKARALLVHEMVHFLQDRSGEFGTKTCEVWVEREHEAYRLQFLYFSTHGGNPFQNRMPALSKARCRR